MNLLRRASNFKFFPQSLFLLLICSIFSTSFVHADPNLARAALKNTFYRDNPLPRVPSKKEYDLLKKKIFNLSQREKDILEKVYSEDWKKSDLTVYALRDTDLDGIPDFSINQYDGRLTDGDTDLDGDGILNAADADPYNKSLGGVDLDGDLLPDENFVDLNHNMIPDHLELSLNEGQKSLVASALQEKLYKEYKIAVVDRSSEWTLESLEALYDNVSIIYKNVFKKGEVIPTLRTAAAEVSPQLSGEVGEYAYLNQLPANLSVFDKALKGLNGYFMLGLLSHEVGHAFQLDLDYNPETTMWWRLGIAYAPEFNKLLFSLGIGWEIEEKKIDPEAEWKNLLVLYADEYPEATPYDYRYGNLTGEEWDNLLNTYKKEGKDPFAQPEFKENSVISFYSLSSPYEWYSENIIAFVFWNLENSTKEYCRLKENGILREFFTDKTRTIWDLDYSNLEDSNGKVVAKYWKQLSNQFPLTPTEWKELAKKYIENSYSEDLLCSW